MQFPPQKIKTSVLSFMLIFSMQTQTMAYEQCMFTESEASLMEQDLAKLANAKTIYANKDSDGDGMTDWFETQLGYNPYSKDTDMDGLDDFWEVNYGLDPLSALDAGIDSDGDGFSNIDEYKEQTNPTDANDNFDTKIASIMVPIVSYLLS